jgi:hypothetical protein
MTIGWITPSKRAMTIMRHSAARRYREHEAGTRDQEGPLVGRILDPRLLIEHQAIAEAELRKDVLWSARIRL